MQIIKIPKAHARRSLGNYLKKELKLPVGLIHKLLRQNKIKLNGQKPDLNWILQENYELKIFTDLNKKDDHKLKVPALFYKKNLQIIFENNDFFALNKPAGLATQPTKNIPMEKTVDGLSHFYGQQNKFRPYLVHRLDKDTSGIILIAKTPPARDFFHDLFKNRHIQKTYVALVKGIIKTKTGAIKSPIIDNTGQTVSAESHYRVLQTFKNLTLVEVKPLTGRFHQIRQHLKNLGHPIIQDQRYGDFNLNKIFQKKYNLKRQFLHAVKVEFNYQNQPIIIEAPLTDDLKNTLKMLRNVPA